MQIKALSLTQPWATLVAIGAKRIETRSWNTDYRGPLAIHAAKGFPKVARHLCVEEPFLSALMGAGLMQYGIFHASNNDLPLGAIIATCKLVGVDRFGYWVNDRKPMRWAKGPHYYELTEQERAFGDYTIGRYGLFLANVKILPEPIPAKGALGLWNWEAPDGLIP